MNDRLPKINDQIRDLMQEIFLKEFGSSLGLISIMYVKTSPDLRNTRIYISSLSIQTKQDNSSEIVALLNQKASKLRKLLSQKLKIKYIPQLSFFPDQTLIKAQRVEELIKKIQSK
ncbi:MAG: 30S ribosome-binding factor RbfA [Patescibacteria group bacterium]